jgi:hypothetical protein
VPVVLAVILAIICCVVILGLIGLQVALLLGAPIGHLAWGGEDYYLQPQHRTWALLAILGYAVSGVVVLQGADVFSFEGKLVAIILTGIFTALYFGAFILSSRSRSALERNLSMGVHLGLAALFLVVAVIGHLNA